MSEKETLSAGPLTAGDPLSEQPEPEPPQKQRSAFILPTIVTVSIALGFAYVVALALWTYRLPIVNALAPAIAKDVVGIDISLRITAIDSAGIQAEDILVADGPSLRTLRLDFSEDILNPPYLEALAGTGLTAALTLADDGSLAIEGLPIPEPTEGEEDISTGLALPFKTLDIREIAISAGTPLGRQELTGYVTVDLPNAPALFPARIDTNLEDARSQSALIADISLETRGIAGEGTVDLSLSHWLPVLAPPIEEATGRATLTFDIQGGGLGLNAPPSNDPAMLLAAVSANAELAWAGFSAQGDQIPTMTVSDAATTVTSEGGIIEIDLPRGFEAEVPVLPEVLLEAVPELLRGYLTGPVQIAADSPSETPTIRIVPDRAAGWRGDFGVTLGAASGPLSVEITPEAIHLDQDFVPTRLRIAVSRTVLLRGLDLPRDIAAELNISDVDVSLNSLIRSENIPALALPFELNATVFGDIADPLWAERTDITFNGTVNTGPGLSRIQLALDPGSRLSTRGLTGTGDVRLSPNLAASVPAGARATVAFDPSSPVETLDISGALRLDPLEIALEQQGQSDGDSTRPTNLRFSPQNVSIRYLDEAITLALGPFEFEETATELSLRGANLHLQTAGRTGNATLTADGLALADKDLLPGALSLQLNGRYDQDGTLQLGGPVSIADGRVSAAISASLNPDAAVLGRFSVNSAPIVFSPTDLSLADFMPVEAFPSQAPSLTGTFNVSANGVLGDTVSGAALVSIEGVSAQTPEGSINDLTGRLVFDIANFPATADNQTLDAVLSVPGLGRIPMHADFQMASDTRIHFNEVRLEAIGGTISLIDTSIDPRTLTGTGTLQIRRINLERLARLAGISGVSATGRLSGLLPLRYQDGEVIVEDGTLSSDGGGRLMVDNPSVAEALAGQGETVQFVASILQDFHYDSLDAELSLPDAANGRAQIGLRGRNPSVLDGHPIDLNVSLSTDHRALYDLIGLVAALPTRLLRRLPDGRLLGE